MLVPILVGVSIIAVILGTGVYFMSAGIRPAGYHWFFPFPFFPLIFIPVAILIFSGFRWFFWGWGPGAYYLDPALTTLRERYAKGEISKEQLDQMTKNLGQT